MKNVIVVLMMFIGANAFGQKGNYIEINFKVSGVCGMCEDRIEKALDVKGVRVAEWDKNSQNCKVIYNTAKISEIAIHEIIAKAGHDTDKVKATTEDYDNLHGCCKYREDAVH